MKRYVWEKTLRVWPNEHLTRLLWIRRRQMLFIRKMKDWLCRHFGELGDCYFRHKPRMPGTRGQNGFKGGAQCSHGTSGFAVQDNLKFVLIIYQHSIPWLYSWLKLTQVQLGPPHHRAQGLQLSSSHMELTPDDQNAWVIETSYLNLHFKGRVRGTQGHRATAEEGLPQRSPTRAMLGRAVGTGLLPRVQICRTTSL